MQYLTDMDKEYKALINLCKIILTITPLFSIQALITKIYRYAKVHNLLGIVNCAVANAENKMIYRQNLKMRLKTAF